MKKTIYIAAIALLMAGIFTACEKEKEIADVTEKTETTDKTDTSDTTKPEKAAALPERIYQMTYGKSFSDATHALLRDGYTLGQTRSMPAMRMPQPEIYQSFIKEFPNRVEDVTIRVNDEQKVDACVMEIGYTTLPEHSEFNAEALSWCEFVKARFVAPTRIDLRMTIDNKWYEYGDDQYVNKMKEDLKEQFEAGTITETEYQRQLEQFNKIPVYPQFYTDILTDFEEYKKIRCQYSRSGDTDIFFQTYGVYDSTNEMAFIVCDMIEILSPY